MTRPFRCDRDGRWMGNAIAYGPFRDGQRPGGTSPSRAELREDLGILAKHWGLLRVYSAVEPTPALLELIRSERLDLRVVLGIWIEPEERTGADGAAREPMPRAREANRREIESAVRLAAGYPEIVAAISVGNETQIGWSAHRSTPELLTGYIREVRARVRAPVTTADDFNFWNQPASAEVARELDFLMVHLHPLWNGIQIDDAPGWVRRTLDGVRQVHPEAVLVIGETGWATMKHDEGEQARLIKGAPGEVEQKRFHDALTAWAPGERIPVFFFEAFDENWKGGDHPDEVEKHWGLYRADRSPKMAMSGKDVPDEE